MLGLGRGNSYSSLSLGGWNHFAVKQIFYFSDIMGHPSKQGRIYSKRVENLIAYMPGKTVSIF